MLTSCFTVYIRHWFHFCYHTMRLSNSVFAKSNHHGPKIYIPWLLLCTAAIPLGHVISPKLPDEEFRSPYRCCRPAARNWMRCAGDLLYEHNSSICKTEVQGSSETTIILTKQHAVIWRKTTLTRDNERAVRMCINVIVCFRVLPGKNRGILCCIFEQEINWDGANQNSIQII